MTAVFRGSYVSMTVWIILIFVLLSFPLIGLPVLIISDLDTAIFIGFGLVLLAMIFTILWFVKLRIIVSPALVTKRTLLGNTDIPLTTETGFYYHMVRVHLTQFDINDKIGSALPMDMNTNITIRVKHGTQKMRITSGVKKASMIAALFHKFEMEKVYPHLFAQMKQGYEIDSGALKQDSSIIWLKGHRIHKPLQITPELKDGYLIIKSMEGNKSKRHRIKFRKIKNPHATIALLSDRS